MINSKYIITVLVSGSLILSACSSTSETTKISSTSKTSTSKSSNANSGKMSDSQKTEAQGALFGALLGAVVGRAACKKKNRFGCIAIGAGVGAVAGSAYGRKIAKQKEKYVKLEDFYGNTINDVSADNRKLVVENTALERNIARLKNDIHVAKASSLSSSKKKEQLAKIKNSLDSKISQNNNLIKKYNGNLAYANAVLEDLQTELSQKKQLQRQMTGKQETASKIASQHTKLKGEIAQLKKNIKKLENQNEQLAELDPSII